MFHYPTPLYRVTRPSRPSPIVTLPAPPIPQIASETEDLSTVYAAVGAADEVRAELADQGNDAADRAANEARLLHPQPSRAEDGAAAATAATTAGSASLVGADGAPWPGAACGAWPSPSPGSWLPSLGAGTGTTGRLGVGDDGREHLGRFDADSPRESPADHRVGAIPRPAIGGTLDRVRIEARDDQLAEEGPIKGGDRGQQPPSIVDLGPDQVGIR